jgi:hypothetical protein
MGAYDLYRWRIGRIQQRQSERIVGGASQNENRANIRRYYIRSRGIVE